MTAAPALGAFAGYGIELEYMIVDRQTLSVLPIADALLRDASGHVIGELVRGHLAWSNEIVMHVIELKNLVPNPSLGPLVGSFQGEIGEINRLLDSHGAQLMPGAMHPWMDPRAETRLWPHTNGAVYAAIDRIFDCRQHGMANLQSMHVNLPFAGDAEFARVHAAVRLMLPVLPALAASSPFADGQRTGYLDYRMEAYRLASAKWPSVIGRIVPDTLSSRADFAAKILAPMYREVAAADPQGTLRREWLNGRGAIPRFDRKAIEIRVIDMQECPNANLAVAAAACAAVQRIFDGEDPPLGRQQAIDTDSLARILLDCIRDAEQAVIDDAEYLRLLGFPGRRCEAGELWACLLEPLLRDRATGLGRWSEPLRTILDQGTLARRILRAVGSDISRARVGAVYRELCRCLEGGQMFLGLG